MSHKIKAFLVSLVTGFLFTILMLVGQAIVAKVYFHPLTAAIIVVLWLFWSVMLWGGFFKEVHEGESFFSLRLFKSFAVGLFVVSVILGSMVALGRIDSSYPLAISDVKNINAAGVMFFWILIAGLVFQGMFNPRKKVSKNEIFEEGIV